MKILTKSLLLAGASIFILSTMSNASSVRETCEQWSAVGLASCGAIQAITANEKYDSKLCVASYICGAGNALARLANNQEHVRARLYELLRLGVYGYVLSRELRENKCKQVDANKLPYKKNASSMDRRFTGIAALLEGCVVLYSHAKKDESRGLSPALSSVLLGATFMRQDARTDKRRWGIASTIIMFPEQWAANSRKIQA